MNLRDKLVPVLLERYSAQGPMLGDPPGPIIRFPARHPEFGEVAIFDDGHEATIDVGVFTHLHVAEYADDIGEDERADSILRQLEEWLDALFDDRVIAWGSHESGGGCEWIPYGESLEERGARIQGWVWSGPWPRSEGSP